MVFEESLTMKRVPSPFCVQIGKFQTCSPEVALGFNRAQDGNVDNTIYIEGLLERGIEVFIYVVSYRHSRSRFAFVAPLTPHVLSLLLLNA